MIVLLPFIIFNFSDIGCFPCHQYRAFTSLESTFFPFAQDPTDGQRSEDCEQGTIVSGAVHWEDSKVALVDKHLCA